MPGTIVPFAPLLLHAPALNESDEQMWKVALHPSREFGSIDTEHTESGGCSLHGVTVKPNSKWASFCHIA